MTSTFERVGCEAVRQHKKSKRRCLCTRRSASYATCRSHTFSSSWKHNNTTPVCPMLLPRIGDRWPIVPNASSRPGASERQSISCRSVIRVDQASFKYTQRPMLHVCSFSRMTTVHSDTTAHMSDSHGIARNGKAQSQKGRHPVYWSDGGGTNPINGSFDTVLLSRCTSKEKTDRRRPQAAGGGQERKRREASRQAS